MDIVNATAREGRGDIELIGAKGNPILGRVTDGWMVSSSQRTLGRRYLAPLLLVANRAPFQPSFRWVTSRPSEIPVAMDSITIVMTSTMNVLRS